MYFNKLVLLSAALLGLVAAAPAVENPLQKRCVNEGDFCTTASDCCQGATGLLCASFTSTNPADYRCVSGI